MGKVMTIINKIAHMVSGWCIFLMMFISVTDVIGRYFFNHPLTGSADMIEILMVFAVFLALSYIVSIDGNVRVDVLYIHFPEKMKAVINVFMGLIALALTVVLTRQLGLRALTVLVKQNFTTATLGIPIGPFLAVATLGAAMLCIQLILYIIANVCTAANKKGGKTT